MHACRYWSWTSAGGERRQVTRLLNDHNAPQWSPDGRWLAAKVNHLNGMCSQLAMIEVESGETRLIGPEGGTIGVWAWSPDGDRLIFTGDTQPHRATGLLSLRDRLGHGAPPNRGFAIVARGGLSHHPASRAAGVARWTARALPRAARGSQRPGDHRQRNREGRAGAVLAGHQCRSERGHSEAIRGTGLRQPRSNWRDRGL